MTTGKRRKVQIVVTIEAITNMDDWTLENRLVNFLDAKDLRAQLIDREGITFLATDDKLGTGEEVCDE